MTKGLPFSPEKGVSSADGGVLRFRQREFSVTFVGVGFDRPVIVNSSVCYKAGASPATTYKPISDIVVATLAVAFHTDMSYQAVA